MKKLKRLKIKSAALLLSLTVLLSGCSSEKGGGLFVNDYLNGGGTSQQSPSELPEPDTLGGRGTKLSLTKDKELSIERITKSESSPAPTDGIWTVLVYLCGSTLECKNGTIYGNASTDLEEMIGATKQASNLRFVVEAGGSEKWKNKDCVDGMNTRLLIKDGKTTKLDTKKANMGDPNTLADFINWGVQNYRSQYTMLNFWDHGGGSLLGVCEDTRHSMDCLSLSEIDKALAATLGSQGIKLEAIGCDTCLMATIELANLCVPYANYLIASEETEPCSGWDYSGFSAAVKAGAKNGAELGKYICDVYAKSLNKAHLNGQRDDDKMTLSVMDLSEIDKFLLAFNSYCIDIYDYICNGGYDDFMRKAKNVISFSEGKYLMGDLRSFITVSSGYSQKAERTLSMMDNCVSYKVNGRIYKDAGGISVYYPFVAPANTYVNVVKNFAVTPYYLGIVDVIAYGKSAIGNISGYDPEQWIDDDSEYWSDNDVNESDYDYWSDDSDGSLNTNAAQTGITFAKAPHIETRKREVSDAADAVPGEGLGSWIFGHVIGFVGSLISSEYNVYTFTLSSDGMKKVDTIYSTLFAESTHNGRNVIIDLGSQFIGGGDYYQRQGASGVVEQEFYGMTIGLPSSYAPLSIQPISRRYVDGLGYVNFYTSMVAVNNVQKNLVFYEYYPSGAKAPTYIATGVIDPTAEGEMASRIEPLKSGDSILGLCPAYYADTLEFATYFTVTNIPFVLGKDGDFKLEWNAPLPNGYYRTSYRLTDIYGNTFYTPLIRCQVNTNETWPYQMLG